VTVFDPSMASSDIQAALNQALQQQISNQFGSQRYAFLFKPGQYNVDAQLGYYTSVAGLGLSPDDVTITERPGRPDVDPGRVLPYRRGGTGHGHNEPRREQRQRPA